eukprot:7032608-Pyramimonas_sp.AAC.1
MATSRTPRPPRRCPPRGEPQRAPEPPLSPPDQVRDVELRGRRKPADGGTGNAADRPQRATGPAG